MKPVLVQNLIQAAKKKRGRHQLVETRLEASEADRPPRGKDRSSSIIVAGLTLFLIVVVLTASIM